MASPSAAVVIALLGQQTFAAAGAYTNADGNSRLYFEVPGTPDGGGEFEAGPGATDRAVFVEHESLFVEEAGFAEWFEDVHVLPRSFAFPNLLSPQSIPVEVHSAFRRADHTWSTYVNNAGAGVVLTGAPGLPATLAPMKSVAMTLDVSTSGPSIVDSTLDFGFTIGTILVPITIQRIVLFFPIPENAGEFLEILEWRTDVLEALDGSEQRPSLRKNPRQFFEYDYRLFEDEERQALQNILFGWQALSFGLPVFYQETFAAQAIAAGATTIQVQSTDYRDFREGGKACILVDRKTFDVLEIATGGITPTGLVFTSPTVNAYSIGASVYPLRIAEGDSEISGARFPVNVMDAGVRFRITDNDVDLADVSPFGTFNSKVLFDDDNGMLGVTTPEKFLREVLDIDGDVGIVERVSNWTRHKTRRPKTFFAKGMQAQWEMRGVLYALRGRQISFYLPTFKDDVEVLSDLVSGTPTMSVRNDGYTKFVQSRQSRNVIRVVFVDGSTPLLRTISSSVEVDADTETITVDSNWSSTITPAEIQGVQFVEKKRFDQDAIGIRYQQGHRTAYCSVMTKDVFE